MVRHVIVVFEQSAGWRVGNGVVDSRKQVSVLVLALVLSIVAIADANVIQTSTCAGDELEWYGTPMRVDVGRP